MSRSYVFSQQGRPGREAPVSYSLRAVALARRSASGSDTRATLETDTDRAVRCNEQPGSTERQGPLRSQVAPLLTFSWVWCDHSHTVAPNLYPGSVAGSGHYRLGRLVLPEHEPSYLGLTYLVTSTTQQVKVVVASFLEGCRPPDGVHPCALPHSRQRPPQPDAFTDACRCFTSR